MTLQANKCNIYIVTSFTMLGMIHMGHGGCQRVGVNLIGILGLVKSKGN